MTTWFYGDPHGEWRSLLNGVSDRLVLRGDTVVLLGDYDLTRPLKEAVALVLAVGADVRWILGNHDVHDAAQYDYVTSWADADLGGRVHVTGSGMSVAGLGGVFKSTFWYPKSGGEEPVHMTRAGYLRTLRHCERWRGGVPLRHRDAVFPEDIDDLRGRRADVLVCHEAPTSHRHGFAALDKLAADISVRWVVHGHHHRSYDGELPGGIRVRGLGRAELWRLPD